MNTALNTVKTAAMTSIWMHGSAMTPTTQPKRRLQSTPPVHYSEKATEACLRCCRRSLSLSTDSYATSDAKVIEVIRDAPYVFGSALDTLGTLSPFGDLAQCADNMCAFNT